MNDSPESLNLYRATSYWARLRGLHAYSPLSGNAGLWLSSCNAIHTFGLRYVIDVVFLDRQFRVVKSVYRLRPNRLAFCFLAQSVVELPEGYCERYPNYAFVIQRILAGLG